MHHDPRAIQRFFQSLPSVLDVSTISHLHLVHWPLNQWPVGHTLKEMGFAGKLTIARISTQAMAKADGFQTIQAHDHPTANEPATHILMELPQGREAAKLAVEEALKALPPTGKLWVFGDKESGILPLPKKIAQARNVLSKGHLKLVEIPAGSQWQEKPSKKQQKRPDLSDDGCFHHYSTDEITVATRPGLFSWAEPDPASLMLLEALQGHAAYHLLDWGCGCGLIGTTLAKREPTLQVTLSDDMVRATLCSAETAQLNGVTERCHMVLEDGIGSILQRQSFDTVVTNPPFHRGQSLNRAVAERFIQHATEILERKGTLWLVANGFLDYGPLLKEAFATVEVALRDTKFVVWKATKK
ncbi:class I SAM-dependent methyltransferase [Magnetococcus sp. PR-3]|uniref:class I SAM-dependent methyltransferase n=1 Tax=Magnetococcus sp. PR-3 TaxID=3120355 RepID=UPI002FCE6274